MDGIICRPLPCVVRVARLLLLLIVVVVVYGLVLIAWLGTYPTGITGSTYAHIARAKSPHMVLLVDAYKDVSSVLATGQVDVFKINREELAALVQEVERSESKARPALTKSNLSLSHLAADNGTASTSALSDSSTGKDR